MFIFKYYILHVPILCIIRCQLLWQYFVRSQDKSLSPSNKRPLIRMILSSCKNQVAVTTSEKVNEIRFFDQRLPSNFRCKRVNCTAFVIDFGRSVCYSVRIEDDELVPEPNSIFYHRVCVKGKLKPNCLYHFLNY